MSTPLHALLTGSFTSDGAVKNINLPSGYDSFELINITDIGSSAASTPVMRAQGSSVMPAGSAYYNLKTNGAATNAIETTTATGGFTFVSDSSGTAIGAALNIATGISQAGPAVVTTNVTTNLNNGDIVRVYGTTGMLQIAGMDFTIGALNAGVSYTLAYLDSSGFGAAATAGTARKVAFDSRFYPRNRYITSISKATSAVIVMSVTHGLTVGQEVRLAVPAVFGMTEMDGLLGVITAINTTTNSITVNIDSTAFTTFAFPTSATAALGISFAQVVPVGEAAMSPYQNLLDDATRNTSFNGVQIGTTVQTTAKLYQWFARRGVTL